MQLDFDLTADKTKYDFETLIDKILTQLKIDVVINDSVLGLGMMLKTLEEVSKYYRLEIEARANLFDVMKANVNTTDVALTLKALDRNGNEIDKIFQIVLGSYVDSEDGKTKSFVYVDLSKFNIQTLIIRDAIEYVRGLLGAGGSKSLARALAPYAPQNAASFGDLIVDAANYATMATGEQKEYEEILFTLNKRGFGADVAAGAIYALLAIFNVTVVEDYVGTIIDPRINIDIFSVKDTVHKPL